MIRYGFRQVLSAFFLADTHTVRSWLPRGLHPSEARPGHSILAITAFDFVESEVGAYGELVISVMVRPYAGAEQALPHAASFPIRLATTTAASRAHATEKWKLPQHDGLIQMDFQRDGTRRTVTIRDGEELVLTLSISHEGEEPSTRLYQAFSAAEGQLYRVNLDIEGGLAEHQEQSGVLVLGEHPLTMGIEDALLDDEPYIEQSMTTGEQRFSLLTPHQGVR